MTSTEELQRLLRNALEGNTPIMDLAFKVYDHVPDKPFGSKRSYISFGPIDTTDDDADCIDAVVTTVQVDVWSVKEGAIECRRLTDLVRRALHHKSLALDEHALVDTQVPLTRVIPDPGGYHHGIVSVECMIEERPD